MNAAQSLTWLLAHNWTLPQIAGVAQVSTSAVRAWLQWKTAIPPTPALRLMVSAYVHRVLLVYLEFPPAPNGEHASNAATPSYEQAPGATRIRSFAEIVARHCL